MALGERGMRCGGKLRPVALTPHRRVGTLAMPLEYAQAVFEETECGLRQFGGRPTDV